MENLSQWPLLTKAQIKELIGSSEMCERLMEMGLTVDSEIQVLGRMPLRGPLLVEVKGATVALREQEAQCVLVHLKT